MKKTKLFGLVGIGVLSLGMAIGAIAVPEHEATPVHAATETTTIYLNAGGTSLWDQAGAWFCAWTWGGAESDSWVIFEDTDGDGHYEGEVYSDRTNMKFVRMNPAATEPSWDDGKKWNETGNLSINSTYNCYTITGWGETDGNWSSYTPPSTPVIYDFYLVGNFNSWNAKDDAYKFVYNEEGSNYTIEVSLPELTQFKVTQGSWAWSKGGDAFTSETVDLTVDGTNVVLNNEGAGTHDFLITLPSNFISSGSKGTIEYNENDAEKVTTFVTNYMHMTDVSTDDVSDTGACKGEEGYYAKAKAAYQQLLPSQRELFSTDATYADAWARFQAWAYANGDVIESGSLEIRTLNPVLNSFDNSYMLYVLIGVIAISTICLCILIKRRRATK